MRKAAILLIALLLILSVGLILAQLLLAPYQEQVTWQENTLYGDKSVVEGLTVQTRNSTDVGSLLWTTRSVLGQEMETQLVSARQGFPAAKEEYSGVILSTQEEFPVTKTEASWLDDGAQARFAKLTDFFQNVYDTMSESTQQNYELDLRTYFTYYPLDGRFDLPGAETAFWSNARENPGPSWQAFNDYFKIPILGQCTLLATFERSYYNTRNTSMEVQAFYRPEFSGVTTGDACYFTFDPVAADGSIADCSLIPGGYGIYRFDYSLDKKGNAEADPESLTTAYSLDPAESFYDLWLSQDEDRLLLLTTKDGSLFLTVINLETMTCLQKLEMTTLPADCDLQVQLGDGCITLLIAQGPEENRFLVFGPQQDGTYRFAFETDLDSPAFSTTETMLGDFYRDYTMAFNGEYLVLAQNVAVEEGYLCDFYIVAYNATGMVYAGEYRVNLSEINGDKEAMLCVPYAEDPITICWAPES